MSYGSALCCSNLLRIYIKKGEGYFFVRTKLKNCSRVVIWSIHSRRNEVKDDVITGDEIAFLQFFPIQDVFEFVIG